MKMKNHGRKILSMLLALTILLSLPLSGIGDAGLIFTTRRKEQ